MLELIIESIFHGMICAVFCSLFHILLERHLIKRSYNKAISKAIKLVAKKRAMITTKDDPLGETAKRYRDKLRSEIIEDLKKEYKS